MSSVGCKETQVPVLRLIVTRLSKAHCKVRLLLGCLPARRILPTGALIPRTA